MDYRRIPIKTKGFDGCTVDTNGIMYKEDGSKFQYYPNKRGYYMVYQSGYIRESVHRIVAETFIPNDRPDVATQINHKDGNKLNNCVDNLEWVTPSENMQHAVGVLGVNYSSNNGNARAIRGVHRSSNEILDFSTLADAGRHFRPDNYRHGQNTIWRVLNGLRRTAYGYYWLYTD